VLLSSHMKKRVFIIHAWEGHPEDHWYPWLKKELTKKGYDVIIPQMPDPDEPTIHKWVDRLTKVVGTSDSNTYFIGHSIGCQTIIRYVATLLDTNIGGIVCVAGWFTLQNLSVEEKKIAMQWLETPLDFQKVRNTAVPVTAIFSDNDPYIPLEENRKLFENELGARSIIEHKKGHFTTDDNVKELPQVLALFE